MGGGKEGCNIILEGKLDHTVWDRIARPRVAAKGPIIASRAFQEATILKEINRGNIRNIERAQGKGRNRAKRPRALTLTRHPTAKSSALRALTRGPPRPPRDRLPPRPPPLPLGLPGPLPDPRPLPLPPVPLPPPPPPPTPPGVVPGSLITGRGSVLWYAAHASSIFSGSVMTSSGFAIS